MGGEQREKQISDFCQYKVASRGERGAQICHDKYFLSVFFFPLASRWKLHMEKIMTVLLSEKQELQP